MATYLVTFRPSGFRLCAVPGSDAIHRRVPSSSSPSNWWSPLFGWSSEADYIDSGDKMEKSAEASRSDSLDRGRKPVRSRFSGCFTEEKARQLRILTKETSSFHDGMYHSAVASRLASDFNRRPDQ